MERHKNYKTLKFLMKRYTKKDKSEENVDYSCISYSFFAYESRLYFYKIKIWMCNKDWDG